jgi:hypothetical protein
VELFAIALTEQALQIPARVSEWVSSNTTELVAGTIAVFAGVVLTLLVG